jgi:hypothetical protein
MQAVLTHLLFVPSSEPLSLRLPLALDLRGKTGFCSADGADSRLGLCPTVGPDAVGVAESIS